MARKLKGNYQAYWKYWLPQLITKFEQNFTRKINGRASLNTLGTLDDRINHS